MICLYKNSLCWYVARFAFKAIRTTGFLVVSHMTSKHNLSKFPFVEISKTGNFVHHSYLCGLLNFSFGDFPKRKTTLPPGKGVKPLSRGRGVPVQPEMRGKWGKLSGPLYP